MSKAFKEVNLQGCVSGKLEVPNIGENGNWWIGMDDTGVVAQGVDGAQGPQGLQGEKGDTGEVGPAGAKGDKGDKGDTGVKGDKGESGAQGPQGIQGPQGEQGLQGEVNPADLERIDGELAELNQSLNECNLTTEGSGVNTKYYIQAGADAASKKLLGRSSAIVFTSNVNMSTYCVEYQKLTGADFKCGCTSASMSFGGSGSSWDGGLPPETSTQASYSYNASTGVLSMVNGAVSRSDGKDNELHHNTGGVFVVWLGTVAGK